MICEQCRKKTNILWINEGRCKCGECTGWGESEPPDMIEENSLFWPEGASMDSDAIYIKNNIFIIEED